MAMVDASVLAPSPRARSARVQGIVRPVVAPATVRIVEDEDRIMCPKCGSAEYIVLDSWTKDGVKYESRQCRGCGNLYSA